MSKQYSDDDASSHEAGTEDPGWQENVFVHWFAKAAGVGGVGRTGHELNRPGGGRLALPCFVATDEGKRFRRNEFTVPFEASTTPRGFRSGADDRYGVCDCEVTNNARMGIEPIGLALNAALARGVSPRP